MPGAGLTETPFRKALFDMLALRPYWSKPAVRVLEGTMETSASFEARSAPSSYSTMGAGFPIIESEIRLPTSESHFQRQLNQSAAGRRDEPDDVTGASR